MAQGDGVIYNSFKQYLLNGVYNLANGGNAIQVTLHTSYTPNIDTHSLWAHVSATEYGTGSAYTAGGKTLANQTTTVNSTTDLGQFDADDVTWTSLGPLNPATPSHAIVWDTTPTSPADPLMCYFVLGTTATNGGNYVLAFGATGIILLT